MTVRLIGFKRSYLGLSGDEKPVTTDDDTVPFGSTFHEVDTDRVATWDGTRWAVKPTDFALLDRLDSILAELREIKELHTAIATEI